MTSDSCVSCIAQGSYFITDVVNFFAHIGSVVCQFFEVSFVGFSFDCCFIGINFFTIVFYSFCSKLQALRQVNDVFIVTSDSCVSCIAQGSYFITDVVNFFAHIGSVVCQFFEVSFVGFSFNCSFVSIYICSGSFDFTGCSISFACCSFGFDYGIFCGFYFGIDALFGFVGYLFGFISGTEGCVGLSVDIVQ